MKTRTWLIGSAFCLATFMLFSACSKSGQASNIPPMEVEGVKVDAPQLMAEFLNASPDVQSQLNTAVTKVRYKLYLEAMVGLDEVLKSPELNDKQKQLITKVIGQIKEVESKTQAQPNQ
jgi:hypothetical protein